MSHFEQSVTPGEMSTFSVSAIQFCSRCTEKGRDWCVVFFKKIRALIHLQNKGKVLKSLIQQFGGWGGGRLMVAVLFF